MRYWEDSPVHRVRKPAIFLDRDGTINRERHYLSDPDQLQLIPGAVEGLLNLQKNGYRLVVVIEPVRDWPRLLRRTTAARDS